MTCEIPTDVAWAKLEQLLACLTDALPCSGGGNVCSITVQPGTVAFDTCEQGTDDNGDPVNGQAWVREVRRYMYSTFPNVALGGGKCDTPLAAVIELGISRCAPTIGNDGTLPDAATMTAAAMMIGLDVATLLEVVCCAFNDPTSYDTPDYMITDISRIGPAGGCIAATLTLTVDLA